MVCVTLSMAAFPPVRGSGVWCVSHTPHRMTAMRHSTAHGLLDLFYVHVHRQIAVPL